MRDILIFLLFFGMTIAPTVLAIMASEAAEAERRKNRK